jgi:hypothetical protein
MRFLILILAISVPVAGFAMDKAKMVETVVNQHILQGFSALAASTATLAQAANNDCSSGSLQLQTAYHSAFDDWMSVSHLQFGPLEAENRGFDLAFWPDPRGFTPKALSQLINDQDPIIANAYGFSTVSVAAKGFYGLEFLLFDPQFSKLGTDEYRCKLIRASTGALADTAAIIHDEWQNVHADQMIASGPTSIYRTYDEALRTLFRSLETGLQFTSEVRLGRPLGTFDRPRPSRAEARRSGRSLNNVILSLSALDHLGSLLAQDDESVALFLSVAFSHALDTARNLDDPVFADVSDVQCRLKVEILQQEIDKIRDVVSLNLGPTLGVAAGFNAMDGD